jgi:catechol 2,3-dioxygenase-like lactoylglutathione lyase family enzyme
LGITGIESLIYGVEDVETCTRFFTDFGLIPAGRSEGASLFKLPEGSNVVIRPLGDPALPHTSVEGPGVREVIWGVDSTATLETLAAGLATDREVRHDADGTAHFATDIGLAMGLRVFAKHPVASAPDPVNSPGRINRLNNHRKWRKRARPKLIAHVVYQVPDYETADAFMCERLNFRLSDWQRGFGKYLRADGSNEHHNLLLLNANAPVPGMDGKPRFHHANFEVEDIDEIMVGANYMTRRGWPPSLFGLGRHRIDSALFYYLPAPTGGEAEYGADGDAVDDGWVPRDWPNPLFGYAHFVHNLPPFLQQEPPWIIRYLDEPAAADGGEH